VSGLPAFMQQLLALLRPQFVVHFPLMQKKKTTTTKEQKYNTLLSRSSQMT
jgi:hypothetical protein